MPSPILERLSTALQRVANTPDVKAKLADMAIFSHALILREFDEYIKADMNKQRQIAAGAHIEPH